MASGDAVQQIKDRLNIIDVISPYVELHKAGRHFKGKSPFTNEKTPSFFVSPERGMYYCFSTSQGGDIFKFIEVMEGVDFKEALKLLAEKAGVELVAERPEKKTERDGLYAILAAATEFYQSAYSSHVGAQTYLVERGVKDEIIAGWQIGYAPGPPTGGWRELRQHLLGVGFSDTEMFRAGLIKSAEAGKEPYDVFRDRVMFPLRDQNGRVVAFSGRLLTPNDKAPKYVNSPETDLYKKSDLLYGYDRAKQQIRQLGFWLIVEGQFDVVMCHQVGYTNTVAVSGTAFTEHHAQLLERLSTKVVLALDADKAGIAAMKRAADLLLHRGFDVKVASLPDGSDPADIAATDAQALKRAVGSSVHVIDFLIAHVCHQVTDPRARLVRVREEVIPFITLLPSRLEQEHFEKQIATALGTSIDAVHYEVTRQREEGEKRADHAPAAQPRPSEVPDPASVPASIPQSHAAQVLLAAAMAVVPSAEGAFIKAATEALNVDITAAIPQTPVNDIVRVTFEVERDFARMTERMRREELVHAVNRWRTVYIKERIAATRATMVGDEAADAPVLEQILLLQQALQRPPYTLADIDKFA